MTAARPKCRSCGHTEHRGECKRRGRSRCVPLGDRGPRPSGYACGYRPQCPCPWRTCTCGTPVAVAACADDPAFHETIERGSAGHPDGTLAVRRLPDGTLSARPIPAGGELTDGEFRGLDHDARCPDAAKRGVVDATDSEGHRVPVAGEAAS